MTNTIRFDWVISLGQVLTLITLITAAVFAYANLDRSVTEHERRIGAIEILMGQTASKLAQQDVLAAETKAKLGSLENLMGEVRDELRTINRRTAP